MARFSIGQGDYYTKYSNYENYLRTNAKKLGLNETQINEQLGRYSVALQDKENEVKDLLNGRKKAAQSAISPEGKKYLQEVKNQLEATGKTTNLVPTSKRPLAGAAYAAKQNSYDKIWSPEVVDLGHTTQNIGTSEGAGVAAPLGDIVPEGKTEFQKAFEKSKLYKLTNGNCSDRLGGRKQKEIADEIKKLMSLAATPEEQQMLQNRIEKFSSGANRTAFTEAFETAKNANPIENKTPFVETPIAPEAGKKPYVKPEVTVTEKTPVQVIEESAATGEKAVQGATEGVEQEAKTAAKESKGLWNTVKNAVKGKKGKVAIAVGAAAVVGAGLYAILGGKGDEKTEEIKPDTKNKEPKATSPSTGDDVEIVDETIIPDNEEKTDTTKAENPTPVVTPLPEKDDTVKSVVPDSTKVDKANKEEKIDTPKVVVATPDSAQAKAAEEEKEIANTEKADEAEAAQKSEQASDAKQTEQEIIEQLAKKGDNYWKYAKLELAAEHQGDANYKPTNKEVYDRMLKIMKRNGAEFAQDGIHTTPILKVGDKVKVAFNDRAA